VLYNGSSYVEITDTNEQCGSCHTMGDAGLGDEPHHPQIEMRTGTGGIGIDDRDFMESVECYDCHGFKADHSFKAVSDACAVPDCHEAYTNKTAQIQIDFWQNEIESLLERVYINLSIAESAKQQAEENGTWSAELNESYNIAEFNYHFVEADGSSGVHNPDYAISMLNDVNKKSKAIIDQVGLLPPIMVSPPEGETNVSVDSVIKIQFEKEINFTGLFENNYLTVSGGVMGIMVYDTTFTITFTPVEEFEYFTEYTVVLTKEITYADETPVFSEDYSWSFKTEIDPYKEIIISIGPIVDKHNKPFEGVKVTIEIEGEEYDGVTDESGYADIHVSAYNFIPGVIDITLSKDDFDDRHFNAEIGPDGNFVIPEGGIPQLKETEIDEGTAITFIVFIVLIIIILMLFLLGRKPVKEERVLIEEEGLDEDYEVYDESTCPICGNELPSKATVCPKCKTEFETETEEDESEPETKIETKETEAENESNIEKETSSDDDKKNDED
jgi:hypothetical protein